MKLVRLCIILSAFSLIVCRASFNIFDVVRENGDIALKALDRMGHEYSENKQVNVSERYDAAKCFQQIKSVIVGLNQSAVWAMKGELNMTN